MDGPSKLPPADAAVGPGAVEVVALLLVLTLALVPAFHLLNDAPSSGAGAAVGEQRLERELRDVVQTGQSWCCPEDPTAPGILSNLAFQAWANHTAPLEATFSTWFTDPSITGLSVSTIWAPTNATATPTTVLYQNRTPGGRTVGAQSLIAPAPRGPAHVTPVLENLTQGPSAVLVTPLDWAHAYRAGPQGANADHLGMLVEGHREAMSQAGTTVDLDAWLHTTLAGPWRPAVQVAFQEPDWQADPIDLEDRGYALVVTEEDLDDEEGAFGDGDPATAEDHAFQVEVVLEGPGRIATADPEAGHSNGDPITVEKGTRLEVQLPRNWTQPVINATDQSHNDAAGWQGVTVHDEPGDRWRITAYRDTQATYRYPVDTARGPVAAAVIEAGTRVQESLRFHAAPPDPAFAGEDGHGLVTAQVRLDQEPASGQGALAVELASSADRVAEGTQLLAPRHVPTTPLDGGGTPEAVTLALGTILQAGEQALEVDRVAFQAPAGALWATGGHPTPLVDFAEEEGGTAGSWALYHQGEAGRPADLPDDGDLLVWTPASAPATCPAGQACPLAAEVGWDGAELSETIARPPVEVRALYERDDLVEHTTWFVDHAWAYQGVAAEEDPGPGFAAATGVHSSSPGPGEGTVLVPVEASTGPLCEEDDIDERNQAPRTSTGTTHRYDLGPEEDGLPIIRTTTGSDGCTPDPGFRETFHLVAQAGNTSTGGGPLTSIGHGSYQARDGYRTSDQRTVLDGLLTSRLTGDEVSRAGSTVSLELELGPLIDALGTLGTEEATVRVQAIDPFNAWEELAWTTHLVAANATLDLDGAAQSCDLATPGPCLTTLTPTTTLTLPLPEDTLPGTHAIVAQIAFNQTGTTGQHLVQTGRLVHPVDVLTQDGHTARPGTLDAVAWLSDWG